MDGDSSREIGGTGQERADDVPPPAERRPSPRKRVLLRGVVTYLGGTHSFDCMIRDLSESGARISLSAVQPISSHVYLIDVRGRTAYEATVVWNKGMQLGLKFLKTLPLANVTDPELAYLAKLWHGRAVR